MEGGFLEDAFDVDGKLACCGLLVPFLLADLAELLTPDFRSRHLITTSQRAAVCLTAVSLMPDPRERAISVCDVAIACFENIRLQASIALLKRNL